MGTASMGNFAGSVWWMIVSLGVLVTFHEFGHFWVARRFGVKVLRFSVGFGRPLWLRERSISGMTAPYFIFSPASRIVPATSHKSEKWSGQEGSCSWRHLPRTARCDAVVSMWRAILRKHFTESSAVTSGQSQATATRIPRPVVRTRHSHTVLAVTSS